MYVVVNRITVQQEHADEFAAAFAESMAHLEGVPGLRRSTLLAPSTPDGAYLTTMEFDRREDFQAWLGSAEFQRAHATVVGSEVITANAVETYDVHTQV